jgi:LysR family hydrogen peroxide-inducible transcriptional activator
MLTLRQLRYLDALAATSHFGRAAAALGVTQPALSVQVRELERVLGAPLVDRLPGGARLTAFGREVVARSANILAAIREMEELGLARGRVLGNPLRLGVIPSIAPYLLPTLLSRIGERYPDAAISVRETVTRTLIDEIAAGEIDAMVASLPLGDARFEEAAAFEDRFLLAVPAASAHARQSLADPEMIAADELLLLEDGHCLRDQALTVCRAIDPSRLRSFGATSLTTIFHLVAAGQGITLVPAMAADVSVLSDPRLKLIRFADPEPHRTVGLAWRRGSRRERDFRALAELLREGRESSGGAAASRGDKPAARRRRQAVG